MAAKYWCERCCVYAEDTRPGRARHEASARHRAAFSRLVDDARRTAALTRSASSPALSYYSALEAAGSAAGGAASDCGVSEWAPVDLPAAGGAAMDCGAAEAIPDTAHCCATPQDAAGRAGIECAADAETAPVGAGDDGEEPVLHKRRRPQGLVSTGAPRRAP